MQHSKHRIFRTLRLMFPAAGTPTSGTNWSQDAEAERVHDHLLVDVVVPIESGTQALQTIVSEAICRNNNDNRLLCNREPLVRKIHEITTIPEAALLGQPLADFSVGERMRWAEKRQTKKAEDKAYRLLGIFQVFMPLIYGEGDNAFHRLKKKIGNRRGSGDSNQPTKVCHQCHHPSKIRSSRSRPRPVFFVSLSRFLGSSPPRSKEEGEEGEEEDKVKKGELNYIKPVDRNVSEQCVDAENCDYDSDRDDLQEERWMTLGIDTNDATSDHDPDVDRGEGDAMGEIAHREELESQESSDGEDGCGRRQE